MGADEDADEDADGGSNVGVGADADVDGNGICAECRVHEADVLAPVELDTGHGARSRHAGSCTSSSGNITCK